MARKFIAVDCGKADTKICIQNTDGSATKKILPTRMSEVSGMEDIQRLSGENVYTVGYDGQEYVICSEKSRGENSNSKKMLMHKIMTLSAIALNVNNDDYVNVAIGCPLDCFEDKEEKVAYRDFILPKGRVDITINGNEKHFIIDKRMVFPESYGPMFLFPEKFASKTVGVIDIGGFNVNGCYFNDSKLVSDYNLTSQCGKRYIVNEIIGGLRKVFEYTFSEQEMEVILKNGYVTVNSGTPEEIEESRRQSEKVLNNKISEYLDKIIRDCAGMNWGVRFCNFIFIGGTSEMIRKHIEAKYPTAFIPEESNFINAMGFLRKLYMTTQ